MHLFIGHDFYLIFRHLLGLESTYRPKSKEWQWGWILKEASPACIATVSGDAITVSSGNTDLILSERGEKSNSTVGEKTTSIGCVRSPSVKKDSSSCPHLHQGFPTHSYSNLKYPIPTNQFPHFNSRHTARLSVQLAL